MKKFLSKIVDNFDVAVLMYVLCGVLLSVGIAELMTGHYHRAFNSFLYVFIAFMCAKMSKRIRELRAVCIVQHKMIVAMAEDDDEKEGPYLPQEFEDDLSDVVEDYINRGDFHEDEPLNIDFGMKTDKGEYAVELKVEKLQDIEAPSFEESQGEQSARFV